MALRNKQKAFVEAYLRSFNATQAAKDAGYSDRTAYSIGQRLLKNVEASALIQERLDEMTMETDEILIRLTDQARSSLEVFMNFDGGTWNIDLNKAHEAGKLHLIKSIKKNAYGFVIEMYDSQKALELLGRAKKLFTDSIKLDAPQLQISGLEAALDKAYGPKSG
jgi:phage terminase small subunit